LQISHWPGIEIWVHEQAPWPLEGIEVLASFEKSPQTQPPPPVFLKIA
jgi:hypothetical protein